MNFRTHLSFLTLLFSVSFLSGQSYPCDFDIDCQEIPKQAFIELVLPNNPNQGEVFCIDLKGYNWEYLAACELILHFDPTILQFENLDYVNQNCLDGLGPSNFYTGFAEEGRIVMVYTNFVNFDGICCVDNAQLTEMCFSVIGNGGDKIDIELDEIEFGYQMSPNSDPFCNLQSSGETKNYSTYIGCGSNQPTMTVDWENSEFEEEVCKYNTIELPIIFQNNTAPVEMTFDIIAMDTTFSGTITFEPGDSILTLLAINDDTGSSNSFWDDDDDHVYISSWLIRDSIVIRNTCMSTADCVQENLPDFTIQFINTKSAWVPSRSHCAAEMDTIWFPETDINGYGINFEEPFYIPYQLGAGAHFIPFAADSIQCMELSDFYRLRINISPFIEPVFENLDSLCWFETLSPTSDNGLTGYWDLVEDILYDPVARVRIWLMEFTPYGSCTGTFVDTLTFHLPIEGLYEDLDGDGFGGDYVDNECFDATGYVSVGGDCDDHDPNVNPNAIEICDDIDNNCDWEIDEGLLTVYFLDNDADGFGDPTDSMDVCTQPMGYVDNKLDCDDNNPEINPDAIEICDEIDNNCDGQIDEGLPVKRYYEDNDLDGYGDLLNPLEKCFQPNGYVLDSTDCNDQNASVFPGALEICDNMDNNCSGEVDEGLEFFTYYMDLDNDGFGDDENEIVACAHPPFTSLVGGDCNDMDSTINPDAIDDTANGIDENCDGVDGVSAIHQTAFGKLIIYPNPIENSLWIKSNYQALNLLVLDANGRQIIALKIEGEVDLSKLNSGIYIILLKDDNNQTVATERVEKI